MRLLAAVIALSLPVFPLEAQPDKPAAKAAEAAPILPEITLLESGSEPRRALRYSVSSPARVKYTMTMKMSMGMGDTDLPQAPPMTMTMEAKATPVADGRIELVYTVSGGHADAKEGDKSPMADSMNDMFRTIEGMSGRMLMSDRGAILNCDLTLPEAAPQFLQQIMSSLKDSMSQFCPPLPEQPVGVGARWRVAMHPSINGIKLGQTALMELAESDGTAAILKITVDQDAAAQDVTSNLLPPGAPKMHINSLKGSGHGQMSLDMGFPMPLKATMASQTDEDMAIADPSKPDAAPKQFKMKLGMEVTLTGERLKDPAP